MRCQAKHTNHGSTGLHAATKQPSVLDLATIAAWARARDSRFCAGAMLGMLLLALGLSAAPLNALAGGGGSGAKVSTRFIRVKNLSAGPVPSGTAVPLLSLDTREVGDPGNAALVVNTASLGSVIQSFRIATHEVTLGAYVTFLNAVGTRLDAANGSIINSLYDSRMASDANVAGITRTGDGSAGAPYQYAVVGDARKPVAYVSWFNAARFANWMHNGAAVTSDTETGAYPLNLATTGTILRTPQARWWIPTQDEWFKAAYYKGGNLDAGYWKFPTQSDTLPGNRNSDLPNQANFLRLGVFSVTQLTASDPAQNYLTSVGTFSASPGPYGTFDQGGNLDEWTDTVVVKSFGESRVTRGGAWSTGGLNSDLQSTPTALPGDRLAKLGFRLARTAPGPGEGSALTGDFIVSVSDPSTTSSSGNAPVAAGKTVQLLSPAALPAGPVTVTVTDSGNPQLQASRSVPVNARIVCLTVSNAGGVITLSAPVPETPTCAVVP